MSHKIKAYSVFKTIYYKNPTALNKKYLNFFLHKKSHPIITHPEDVLLLNVFKWNKEYVCPNKIVQHRFTMLGGNQTKKLVLEKMGSVLGYICCVQCAVCSMKCAVCGVQCAEPVYSVRCAV